MSEKTNTESACPACGRHGKSGVEGYCTNHLPKELAPGYFHTPLGEEDKHVLTSFEDKYNVDRPFIPMVEKPGIIKSKFGIEK